MQEKRIIGANCEMRNRVGYKDETDNQSMSKEQFGAATKKK